MPITVAGQLEDPCGTTKVTQPVFTEIVELYSVGSCPRMSTSVAPETTICPPWAAVITREHRLIGRLA